MNSSDRFWSRVEGVGDDDGCWMWTGPLTNDGYGRFSIDYSYVYAHRWAYEEVFGNIADGLQLDHLCRNRACVNPSHLEPVTQRENILRGDTLPAVNAAKTHCDHGHEFTPENTYTPPKEPGVRRCRECVRRRQREMRARRRALLSPEPSDAAPTPLPTDLCKCGHAAEEHKRYGCSHEWEGGDTQTFCSCHQFDAAPEPSPVGEPEGGE